MRLTQHSFDTVAVIGRGAFGEVHTPEPPSLLPPPEHLLPWPLRSLVFARGCFVCSGFLLRARACERTRDHAHTLLLLLPHRPAPMIDTLPRCFR
jgi:hypothetical protein